MRILSRGDVRDALPMAVVVECMKEAFASLSRGDATVPPRTQLAAPDDAGVTLVMPARVDSEPGSLAVKVVSVFGRNPEEGLARVQAAVIVLDPGTGRPLALLEGATLTPSEPLPRPVQPPTSWLRPAARRSPSWARACRRAATSRRCARCARSRTSRSSGPRRLTWKR